MQIWHTHLISGHFPQIGVSRRSFICSMLQKIKVVRLSLEGPIVSLGDQGECTISVRLASKGSLALGGKLMVVRALHGLHVACKNNHHLTALTLQPNAQAIGGRRIRANRFYPEPHQICCKGRRLLRV